jgi:hypothetical protein
MVFKGEDYAQYEPNVDFGSFKFYDYTATPEKPHYLTGLYPYKNNQSTQAKWNDDDGDGAYELTLTGMEDLMLATQKTATYKQVYKEDPHEYQVLNFEHQLTLLKLKFIKEDNKPDLNIKLISVKVTDALGGLKLKALAKVSTSPQVVEFPDVITPSYSCYKWGVNAAYTAQTYDVPEEQNVPGDANPDAYVLVPPVDASNADGTFEYTFEIDYENENGDLEQGVPVKVSLGHSETPADNAPVTGSTKGYAYKIVLKFVEGHIRCTAAIKSNWLDGTSTDYDI